jgi:hypothetical protein
MTDSLNELSKSDLERMIRQKLSGVAHPPHQSSHEDSEVVKIAERLNLNFCLGSVVKYVARAGLKGDGDSELEDLRKAKWYLEREIERLVFRG